MADVSALIKRYGITGLVRKAKERMEDKSEYDWTRYAPSIEELEREREVEFHYAPKISIVVPCYNTEREYLLELIRSVKMQSYDNWELILIDASEKALDCLDELHNPNIIVKHLPKNLGISGNTNAGFELATGEFVALLDHDDALALNALYEMVLAIGGVRDEDRNRLLLYSDEDKITASGEEHFYPHFKLDYNTELFRHYNYFCHFTMFSKDLLEHVGGLDSKRNGSQDYDLFLRMLEAGAKVIHVPQILYHWRCGEGSTSQSGDSKMYAYVAGVQAIEEHVKQLGLSAMVSISEDLGVYNVIYEEYSDEIQEISAFTEKERKKSTSPLVSYCCEDIRDVKVRPYSYNEHKNLSWTSKRDKAGWRKMLASYLTEDNVALAYSRTVKNGKVVQCGLETEKDSEGKDTLKPAFYGMPAIYKGYMNRAALPQDADYFSLQSALLLKMEAVDAVGGIRDDLPEEEAIVDLSHRLKEAGYRIILVPTVDAYMN